MPELDQQTIIIIVVVAVVLIALGVGIALLMRRRRERLNRRATLRQRFGPEYDRAVTDSGGEREAVEELSNREGRHQDLSLRDLRDDERDQVRGHMALLQYRFVEEPAETLLETQRIVTEVLDVRGYPIVADRAEGLRMLSVDHPMLTQPVRALLQGEYGDDVAHQRHLFLDVRTALRDIAGVSYDVADAVRGQAVPARGLGHGAAGRGDRVGDSPEAADREAADRTDVDRGDAVGAAPEETGDANAAEGRDRDAERALRPSGASATGDNAVAEDGRSGANPT